MEDIIIRFEVYQTISFTLAFSLFVYMGMRLARFIITTATPKKLLKKDITTR